MRIEVRKLFFDSIGEVCFVKNKKAKRLIIKVKSDGNVRVTVPFLVSYRHATSFVERKLDWIITTQKNLKENRQRRTVFTENSDFTTNNHIVSIERYPGTSFRLVRTGDTYKILIPESCEILSDLVQGKIKTLITEVWRDEAKDILPGRVASIAQEFGFKFSRISIKNMRTRWGSCSHSNMINLNLHLVRLPDHLRDYIILHELIHTVHKNHGRTFWDAMIKANPDSRKLSCELREIKLELW